MAERLARFRESHDRFRSAVVNEPRASDAVVGALLCEPEDPSCAAGVIFFNNVGYLGMCGHGLIGVMATLAHLGRIEAGTYRVETPPGVVEATLQSNGHVSFRNVPSYRYAARVPVEIPEHGVLHGDVAWGGNWFFLVEGHRQEISLGNLRVLTDFTSRIRAALAANGITAADGQEIDHIELFGPPSTNEADSKNFVLCPGLAYDRSPCGTGTSAKLACLFADGKLREGQRWRQESITGSIFTGLVSSRSGQIIPQIAGAAYINAEGDLILNETDPFCYGIPQQTCPTT